MSNQPSANYDYNSTANMLVKERFCAKEIFGDATDMAEYLLADVDSNSPLKWNYELDHGLKCYCPRCGESLDLDIMTSPYDSSIKIEIDEDAPEDERYICPVCGSPYPTEEEARSCCGSRMVYQCPNCMGAITDEELDEYDSTHCPSQWVIVTSWLGEILATEGEIVLCSSDGIYFWGRNFDCDYEEDPVISSLCYSLEILEGQKNFREVKKHD